MKTAGFWKEREKGRRGVMAGVDRTLVHQVERTVRRKGAAEMRAKKEKTAMANLPLLPKLLFSTTLLQMTALSPYKNLRLVHRFLKLQNN